jgi:hypothetical protein
MKMFNGRYPTDELATMATCMKFALCHLSYASELHHEEPPERVELPRPRYRDEGVATPS